MEPMTILTLALYFVVMLGIGLYAYKTSTDDISGYVLGGRNVSPQVTALSAGASDMSGWMLMGLPGAMFTEGYDTLWIAAGLLTGAIANYQLVAPRLRVFTAEIDDALTLPDFFAKRFNEHKGTLRMLTAGVTIVFFTLYTSAGLVAGGKLFETVFNMNYQLGLFVTAGVVVAYTLLGGFLAVSMTDFVQGCIMFLALILVPIVALGEFDSFSAMTATAGQQIGSLGMSMQDITLLGVVSSLAWGLGYFGQPHIIVRFMAIRSVNAIKTARNIGMSWMTVTMIGALGTGLVGVAYTLKTDLTLDDPETIFIVFSQVLFHPLISGFLLAAILAAIMSTISSQLLVSSSSLTEDFYRVFVDDEPDQKKLVMIGRAAVFGVAVIAILLAMGKSNSVLSLVSNAWAGFGAAFGPLVLFSLFWKKLTRAGAIAGVLGGAITVLVWIYLPVAADGATLSSYLYEIVPGFIISSALTFGVSLLTQAPNETVQRNFVQAEQVLEQAS